MPTETEARRVTPGTELLTLRTENDRLKTYLARVLAVLDAKVNDPAASAPLVDAVAAGTDSGVPVLVAAPAPGAVIDLDERLSTVQRDLERIEAHVETLLWRLGDRPSSYASGR